MISRTDIEDMTDAQDEDRGIPQEVWRYADGTISADPPERSWEAQPYVRADLARPSQAGDERLAQLRADVERLHRTVVGAWDRAGTLPAKASVKVVPSDWHDLRNQIEVLIAALAAMDTPKGGGDE